MVSHRGPGVGTELHAHVHGLYISRQAWAANVDVPGPKGGICQLQPAPFVKAGLNNATRAAELHPEESQRPPHVWLEDLQRAKASSLKQPWQLTI